MTPTEIQLLLPLVLPLVIILAMRRRMMRPRKFRLATLGIGPVMILVGIVALMSSGPTPTVNHVAALTLTALAGWGVGWLRAKLTKVEYDEASGMITQRGTPYGLMFLVGLVAVRAALRIATIEHPEWGINLNRATDFLLFFGFGIVSGYAAELYFAAGRARRPAQPQV